MRTILRSDLMIIAAIVFIMLTGTAMLLYPGGTDNNDHANRYSMSQNFFSDLGMTRTYGDHLNIFSMVLFVSSMIFVGLNLALFSLNYRAIYEKKGRFLRLGKASVIFCVISGLSFIAIAAAPSNLFFDAHLIIVKTAFSCLLIFVALITILQIANDWSKAYLSINILYLVVLAGYAALIFLGPDLSTASGVEIQAVGQKIIVYFSIINVGLQAYGIKRFVLARDKQDEAC